MTAAPGPQQPDEVDREAEAFVTLVRTLLISYTPHGAVSWLTSPNRHLNSRRPIDKWSMGYEDEVQEVVDLIDGGLPAAPAAQPAFHEWSVQGYIGPTRWAPDGWTGFHGPYLDARSAWRVYDGQRRLWNKGYTGRPVRLVRRSIGSVEVVHATPARPRHWGG